MTRAIDLFTKVLEACPRHEKAIDHRAECHLGLGDLDSALTDLRELTANFAVGTDPSVHQGWTRRMSDVQLQQREEAHETLGVDRFANAAEVRKAYRNACLQHHPDKHASSTDDARARAKHKFARIQAAYDQLGASTKSNASHFTPPPSASSYRAPPSYSQTRHTYTQPPPSAKQWWAGDGEFDDEDDEEEYEEDDNPFAGRRTSWDSPNNWSAHASER